MLSIWLLLIVLNLYCTLGKHFFFQKVMKYENNCDSQSVPSGGIQLLPAIMVTGRRGFSSPGKRPRIDYTTRRKGCRIYHPKICHFGMRIILSKGNWEEADSRKGFCPPSIWLKPEHNLKRCPLSPLYQEGQMLITGGNCRPSSAQKLHQRNRPN